MVNQPNPEGSAGQRFEVQHDALNAAAGRLPEHVTGLGSTRELLMARQLSADAFAEVDASSQASASHSSTVRETGQRLTAAAARLDEIIDGIHETSRRTGEWDQAEAGEQQKQLAQLDQSGAAGTIRWPNGATTPMRPGGTYYAPKHRNPGDTVTEIPSEQLPARTQRQQNGDDLIILQDGTRIFLTDRPIPDS